MLNFPPGEAVSTEMCVLFPRPHRQPSMDVNRQVIARNAPPERLWVNSREPIRQPLLKKLVGNQKLSQKASVAFTDILNRIIIYQTEAFFLLSYTH